MDMEDTDLDLEYEEQPYEHFEQVIQTRIHHFYLTGEIGTPKEYIKMIHTIAVAPENDVIYIHLNTEGGDLATGIQLINAIKSSPAHVICSLDGDAFSLGSLIFLAGDEFIIHNHSRMMIHNFTGGTYGKGNEQVSRLESDIKWFKDLSADYYIPFVTDTELDNILKGSDLWLQAPDIRKRLTKMIKSLKSAKTT